MNAKLITELFRITAKYPLRLVRKFSIKKIRILVKAIRNEPPELIIRNFKRFIKSDGNTEQPNQKFDKEQFKKNYFEEKHYEFTSFLKKGKYITFNKTEKPVLSIAVVLYNKVGLTLACIQSIKETVKTSYQLIIVDNNSTDQTSLLLKRIEGADIIINSENLHFNKANNQALQIAKGKYFLMLNNDTVLKSNTVENAINTIKDIKKCGAVGAKLIFPDGKLQEAGSIIWNDASCYGYGRNDNPDLPQYNFLREVDYCSGAFLLTKTSFFKEHGGFDPLFEPAYYEETDYCKWLTTKGYKIIYNPKVELTHFEFGSGLSDWAIGLQLSNQQKFRNKHTNALNIHPAPDFSNLLYSRFAASQQRPVNVLYIDDRVPHRDFGSGFPRSNTIVNCIQELGYGVTIYPLNFPDEDTWDVAYRDIDPRIEIAKGYGLSGFDKFIHERANYYQIIWISRPHNMEALLKYIEPLKETVKIIYDAEAIFAQREIALLELKGEKANKKLVKEKIEKEISLTDIADTVISVSENDAQYFRKFGTHDVKVLGHTIDIKPGSNQFAERKDLLFVGNLDYNESPNTDSLIWFIDEVFPIIQQQIKGIKLNVVGSANAPILKNIKNKAVVIHGRVDTIDKFYNRNKVFIAPTRFAAGIPFKIHEAAANHLPAVTTQLIANQLNWIEDKEIIIAKIDPYDFAEKVIKLYNNENIWSNIRYNALNRVKEELSIKNYKNIIVSILFQTNTTTFDLPEQKKQL